MNHNKNRKRLLAPALLACALPLLPGCGGSGASGPSNILVGGTLQDQGGAVLPGYRLVLDNNPQLAATTDTRGLFSIVAPTASLTGKDTLSIYDPAGDLADVEPVSLANGSQWVYRVTLPAQGPPTAPPGV